MAINPSKRIIKAFVAALQGITHNAASVPVYMFPPKNAPKFYIQLGNVTASQEGCKDLFGHECTLDVQVISMYDGSYATPEDSEEISDTVLTNILALPTSTISVDNFDMIWLTLDNMFNDQGLFETDRTYRDVMQFRFLINEITGDKPWLLLDNYWDTNGAWVDSAFWPV